MCPEDAWGKIFLLMSARQPRTVAAVGQNVHVRTRQKSRVESLRYSTLTQSRDKSRMRGVPNSDLLSGQLALEVQWVLESAKVLTCVEFNGLVRGARRAHLPAKCRRLSSPMKTSGLGT
jgi:hypothetical protein